jgi:Uma2 family endonuclease
MATNRKEFPQHYYSLDEYFALEQASETRYEYWDGEIVCMSGGSWEHSLISGNVFFRLRLNMRSGRCRAFTSDLPVKTPTLPPYRYPDVTVGCGELAYERIRGVDALLNPVLIAEVLSPSSAARDHEDKFVAYQAIATFREYLLIARDAPRVTHYRRQPDGRWTRQDVTDLNASLTLDSIDCALAMRDIYEGVTFPA